MIPFVFYKNRHTFVSRKFTERVGGNSLTVSSLGSEAWELRGDKREFHFLIHQPVPFGSFKNQYTHTFKELILKTVKYTAIFKTEHEQPYTKNVENSNLIGGVSFPLLLSLPSPIPASSSEA